MNSTGRARFSLLPAVLSVSTSSIFVRYAAAPPLGAAFWRSAVAGVALLFAFLFPAYRREFRAISWGRIGTIALATIIISLHQICFITSLSYTSIAASTFLTSTQPVWTALLGGWLIRERVSTRSLVAVIGALAGMGLITFSRPTESALIGNILAVAAAILASLYSLAARKLRQSTPIVSFMIVVNVSSAIFLGILALIFDVNLTDYSERTWLGLVLLGLVPTLIGHSLLTYAIGHLKAFVVNASILGEPVGATLLAILFFNEYPTAQTLMGGAVVIVCILLIVFEREIPAAVEQT
ncbi:DMT family transporter [bacterium]|nr:DMT family transporter [bacterium]MBU1982856.1 DMT family transporter [bacterium]